MGVAEEALRVNRESVSTMTLCGLSIGSRELLRRPADQFGQDVARLRRLVVTAPTSVGAPSPEAPLNELL